MKIQLIHKNNTYMYISFYYWLLRIASCYFNKFVVVTLVCTKNLSEVQQQSKEKFWPPSTCHFIFWGFLNKISNLSFRNLWFNKQIFFIAFLFHSRRNFLHIGIFLKIFFVLCEFFFDSAICKLNGRLFHHLNDTQNCCAIIWRQEATF